MKLSKPKSNLEELKAHSKNRKSLFVHIQELKEELKKVSWTTKEELKLSTKVVVLATFIFGLGIYLVDFVIKGGLELVRAFIHVIFG